MRTTTHQPSFFSGLITDLLTSFNTLTSQLYQNTMVVRVRDVLFAGAVAGHAAAQSNCTTSSGSVDLTWHAPNATNINNLAFVVNGSGINGIFNSSITPASVGYSTYNWCNMPHVRSTEYPKAAEDYTLEYVEIVSFLIFKLSRFYTPSGCTDDTVLTRDLPITFRSTGTTNEPPTPPIRSPRSRTPGTATTRRYSSTAPHVLTARRVN